MPFNLANKPYRISRDGIYSEAERAAPRRWFTVAPNAVIVIVLTVLLIAQGFYP